MPRSAARRLLGRPALTVRRLEDRTVPTLFAVGTTASPSGLSNNGHAVVADFNGDGNDDVVLTNYGNAAASTGTGAGQNLSVLLGNGGGGFGSPTALPVGTNQYVSFVAVGDVTGDGVLDLVSASTTATSEAGMVTVFKGLGGGSFAKLSQQATGGSNTAWVGLGDFTGEGKLDIIAASFGKSDDNGNNVTGNNAVVFQGDGAGGFAALPTFSTGISFIPTSGAVADFDADGKLDVVFTIPGVPADSTADQPEGFVQFFGGNGAGGFTPGSQFASGGPLPINVTAANLNGDGKPDLVVANVGNPDVNSLYANFGSGSAVGVLVNSGFGQFNPQAPLTAGLSVGGSKGAFAVSVADFNLDGKQDIAAITYGHPLLNTRANVAVYLGTGAGGFGPDANSPYQASTLTGGQFVAAGRFGGTPALDLVAVGDSNKVVTLINQTVAGTPTTTALTAAPNPATYKADVTLTAVVSTTTGTPAGTVTFFSGATALSGAVAISGGGVASFVTNALPVGTNALRAEFAPAAGFSASKSADLSVVVNKAATTTALTATPPNPALGETVTITATVTSPNTTPVGSVTFFADGTALGTPVTLGADGKASTTVSTLAAGARTLTATFAATPNFLASDSNAVTVTVAGAATATALVAAPTAVVEGELVTLTATVTSPAGVPDGGVAFFADGTALGTPVTLGADGKATATVSTLAVGGRTLTARYAGTANFLASDSNPVLVTVAPAPVTPGMTLAASPNPSTFGQPVTFTATLTVPGGTPTGTVTFFSGADPLGTAGITAAAPFTSTLTTANLSAGTFTITAKYSGGPGFEPTQATAVQQVVNPRGTGVTLATSLTPSVVTTTVTFTATVSSAVGTPTGTVQFFDGGSRLGDPVPLGAGNQARLDVATLPVGDHTITAEFTPGSGNYTGSTSAALTQTVARAGVTVVVSGGPVPFVSQPVNLTASVTDVPGIAADPTGQVTFRRGGVAIGSVPLTAGRATLTVDSLPVGDSVITAEYAGDALFVGGTSDPFTQAVAKAGTTLTLTGAGNTVGQPATFTATLAEAPVVGPDPTGSVVFRSGTTVLATVPLAGGTAAFTTDTLPVGPTTVTAEYAGDGNFTGVTSAGVTLVLAPIGTAVTVTLSPNPSVVTQAVTLTAAVTATGGSPAGTVTFFNGSAAVSVPVAVAGGVATFVTTALPVGAASLTARFVSADPRFTDSTSAAVTQTVNQAAPTVGLSVVGTPAVGTAVTLQAVVGRPAGVTADPAGTVTFLVNGVAVGTAPLVGGVATTTTTLPAGTNALAANFGGDTNFSAAAGQTSAVVAPPTTVPPVSPPPPPGGPGPLLVGYREFGVGAGAGRAGDARFYNPDGTERFTATGLFGGTGGVRVTSADFNNDGVADLVAGTGPGTITRVVVLDGKSRAELFSVQPFEDRFTGGVYVAAGDVTGDGVPELVITPDEGGGPRSRVFNGKGFGQIDDFFGIEDPDFRGGARAAVADLTGDGVGDLVVAAGFGGGPRVAVWDGTGLGGSRRKPYPDHFVFEQALRNGAFVAAGDVNADGVADLISGGGPGGGPRVQIVNGKSLLVGRTDDVIANFFAGDEGNRGGVRVVARDLDRDGNADLVVGSGTGAGSRVTGYRGSALAANRAEPVFGFDAFPGFSGGVFVG